MENRIMSKIEGHVVSGISTVTFHHHSATTHLRIVPVGGLVAGANREDEGAGHLRTKRGRSIKKKAERGALEAEANSEG